MSSEGTMTGMWVYTDQGTVMKTIEIHPHTLKDSLIEDNRENVNIL